MQTRFIFITGGVVSSLGKGLAAAALGALLQARGFKVRLRKLDPYINFDPGTLSPYQHGECFVTEDGAETDLDLGHYERFTGVDATKYDNVTTGRIYYDTIDNEREGRYDGITVQVIPHITDTIKNFIQGHLTDEDFVICEIGGTVGDIESLPFLEAIRQFGNEVTRNNSMFVHVTLLPFIRAAGELKTKPTQHSVKELLSVGIQPDLLLCRADVAIPENELGKIAKFCNIPYKRIIPALDANNIYDVPIQYHEAGFDVEILHYFNMPLAHHKINLQAWHDIAKRIHYPDGEVTIAVIGKYVDLPDAYKSLQEALLHGGLPHLVKVKIVMISSESLNLDNVQSKLDGYHAILVPGGFGERGVEGKMLAAHYARTRNIPYLGICFGMQMAVIEFARNVVGLKEANSSELDPDCKTPIVGLLTEWIEGDNIQKRSKEDVLGATMRKGAFPCMLQKNSTTSIVYDGADEISERHRHRYEVNIEYKDRLEGAGMAFVGLSPDGKLPEIVEIKGHPWFIGVQFHPELKSRPFAPHPLFTGFIKAAMDQMRLV